LRGFFSEHFLEKYQSDAMNMPDPLPGSAIEKRTEMDGVTLSWNQPGIRFSRPFFAFFLGILLCGLGIAGYIIIKHLVLTIPQPDVLVIYLVIFLYIFGGK
jgi:hypothetical protein